MFRNIDQKLSSVRKRERARTVSWLGTRFPGSLPANHLLPKLHELVAWQRFREQVCQLLLRVDFNHGYG